MVSNINRDRDVIKMTRKMIKRYADNPIIRPRSNVHWMERMTMNPAVWFDGSTFHAVFTAMGSKYLNGALTIGYAESKDGINFTIRDTPVLVPSKNEDEFDCGTVDDPRLLDYVSRFPINAGKVS